MKHLEERFAEIEARVKDLVSENRGMKGRIHELERELEKARSAVQNSDRIQTAQSDIRQRIEKVLRDLESVSISQ